MNAYQLRKLAAYHSRRAENQRADQSLIIAKHDARYGSGSPKRNVMPWPGSDETTTLPNGWSYKVAIEYDTDSGKPWEEHDGHGVVVEQRCSCDNDEMWLLSSDRGFYLYYDWRATLPIAMKDGWDAPPYRVGNKHECAMRAVKADYESLRRWCNNDWYWVGLIVTLYDENGEEVDSDSCWGFYSDSEDYLCGEARSRAAYMIRKHRKAVAKAKKQAKIASRFHDAMENAL